MSAFTTPTSAFENLPGEIMNNILSHLVGATNHALPTPKRICNRPNFDTAIMRTNKYMHALSKSYFCKENKWIVFDINKLFILQPWINTLVSVIMLDPEAGYVLPEGIMRVQVKFHLNEWAKLERASTQAPSQLVLVQLESFEAFLQCLRQAELTTSLRIMPGEKFRDVDSDMQVPAKAGVHGLNLTIVVVDSGYKNDWMDVLLDKFRIFHGPLNKISIVGAPNANHARSIENSISKPQNTPTYHEVITLVAQHLETAHTLAASSHWEDAEPLYTETNGLLTNSCLHDHTPWNNAISPLDWHDRAFEVLVGCASTLNAYYAALATGTCTMYSSAAAALDSSSQLYKNILLFDDVSMEMVGFFHLLFGLHCIFHARVGYSHDNSDSVDVDRLNVISHGMELVEVTVGLFALLSLRDQVLYRKAVSMVRRLRVLSFERDKRALVEAISVFAGEFSALVRGQGRVLRFAVREELIPQGLKDRGILEHLTGCAGMTDKGETSLVIRAFFSDEEGGVMYCI
jgi:hypothetical protein